MSNTEDQLKRDLEIYGSSYYLVSDDGTKTRIDPTKIVVTNESNELSRKESTLVHQALNNIAKDNPYDKPKELAKLINKFKYRIGG